MNQWGIFMTNLIARVNDGISSFLKELQVKRFLAVVLVGFLLLTTNVETGGNNQALTKKIDDIAHQTDSVRPKTTREWNQEARETEGSPGERLKNIGEESAQAFKEFGSGYVEGAKETARKATNGAVEAGKDLSSQIQR